MFTIIKKHPLISFFVLTFVFNWLGIAVLVAGYFPSFGEWPLIYDGHLVAEIRGRRTMLVWTPTIAAMIVEGAIGGRQAIAQLMRQFLVWRVKPGWWACVFALPVAFAVITVLIFHFSGGTVDLSQRAHWSAVFGLRFIFSLTTGGFGEEAGWRGFVLPRLQQRIGALWASLVIGIIWSFWHMAHWTLIGLPLASVVILCIAITGLSIVLTWVYINTQSLLLVAFMHVMFNAVEATLSRSFVSAIPVDDFLNIFAGVVVVFAAFLTVLTKGKLDSRQRAGI